MAAIRARRRRAGQLQQREDLITVPVSAVRDGHAHARAAHGRPTTRRTSSPSLSAICPAPGSRADPPIWSAAFSTGVAVGAVPMDRSVPKPGFDCQLAVSGQDIEHRSGRYKQAGMTDLAGTRAGMRARSYHASPGEVRSVGGCAPGLWMNCANTLDNDAVPEGTPGEPRRSHRRLPAQMPLTRRTWEKIRKGLRQCRCQIVIHT